MADTKSHDDSKAKSDTAKAEDAAKAELDKPGRYIVDGNVVDPNGQVICEAPAK